MSAHQSDSYEEDDGWVIPRCTCGWQWGPCPDMETATDVLMEHAVEARASEGNTR